MPYGASSPALDRPPPAAAAGVPSPTPRRVAAGLAALSAAHLAVDCCTGIWPVYKTLAGLNLATAGVIASAGSMIGNGLQIPFGILADRGLAKVLLVCGVVLAGATTLFPYAHSYPLLFALVLVGAVGSAAFHPVGAGSAGALSREHAGVLVALFLTGGYVGYSLSQVIFTTTYHATGGATAVLASIPLLAGIALWRFVPRPASKPQSLPAWGRSLRALRRPLAALFGVQMLTAAINNALVFLLPDLLRARGASAWVVEGGGHFALVAGGCLALVPAGHAADRFGARRVLFVINLVTGVLLTLVLRVGSSPALVLPLVAAFGAFNSANNVVVVSEGNRMMPGQTSGVSALLMGLPWSFAAFGPAVAGTLADPSHGGNPALALTWLSLCIPAALGVSLLVGRRRAAV